MQTGEVLRRVVFDLLDAAKGGRLKKLKEVNKREIVEGVTEEYMDRRIHVLLDYVKEHSPYYKDHPEWTELKDFPVMTKGDFIENYDQVLVDNSEEQGKLYRLSTSGSTGTPFTVLCDGDKMSRVNMNFISCMELRISGKQGISGSCDRTCRFDSNGRRGGGGAWRRTGNDREDDVIFTGRRAGPDPDGRNRKD